MFISFANFFSRLQEAPWYSDFLLPVVEKVPTRSRVLDIGTGSGKMLELLYKMKKATGVGIDTNEKMLALAKIKVEQTSFELLSIERGMPYPFPDNSFDCVTICNVLFNMERLEHKTQMLEEAVRLTKKGGLIIILTPTGKPGLQELTKHYFNLKNLGILIWYQATKNNGQRWTRDKFLSTYAQQNHLQYHNKKVLRGFAQMETLNI